jgi:hypothetical protein
MTANRNRDSAATAWGDPPDWIIVLADHCDQVGQSKAAGRLKLGVSTVNEVLRKRYRGRLDNIERAVRGALMGSTVECPVLDEITVDLCLENQRRKFSSANPIRVALHRACPNCPHNRGRKAAPTSQPEETP